MGAIIVVGRAPTDLVGAAADDITCTLVTARRDVPGQVRAVRALRRALTGLFLRRGYAPGDIAPRASKLERVRTFEDVRFDLRSGKLAGVAGPIEARRTDVGIALATTGTVLALDGGMPGLRLRRAPATNWGGNWRIHS